MKAGKIITDYGGHGSVVVLLHGFLSSSTYWKRLQPHLTSAGYRVVAIDLLGFGNATHLSAEAYDYDEHIQHIHESIQSLDLKESFILVGHSMGALLAARYGVIHPDHIQRIFLLHPPVYQNPQQAHHTLRNTGRGYRFLLDSRFRGMAWGILRVLPKVPVSKHTQTSREQSLLQIIESTRLIHDLNQLKIPTVLVVGERDRPEYLENINQLQLHQFISVQVIDTAHHSPVFQPQLVADMIKQYS